MQEREDNCLFLRVTTTLVDFVNSRQISAPILKAILEPPAFSRGSQNGNFHLAGFPAHPLQGSTPGKMTPMAAVA